MRNQRKPPAQLIFCEAAWQVQGVGDLNGDGTDDILWRNSTSGLVVDWLMENGQILDQKVVGQPTLDWQIQGQRCAPY